MPLSVGVNYPWRNYGWDFGIGPYSPRRGWEATLPGDLEALSSLGVFCVRWFILADGITYGSGADAPTYDPRPDALWFGERQWRFNPPRRGPQVQAILDDFERLLDVFRAAWDRGVRVQLLPVVLDFHLLFPGNFESGPHYPAYQRTEVPPPGFVKNGRADLVYDPSKVDIFLDTLLGPLVDLASQPRYRDLIYALEIINEPEWCTRTMKSFAVRETIPLDRMMDFLARAAARINPKLPSTVGFARHGTMRAWNVKRLGLSRPQFHYYGLPESLPRSCGEFVGEFGTGELRKEHWWPELREQSVRARLSRLEARGYGTAFLWSRFATDDDTRWNRDTEEAIREFAVRPLDAYV